jgi:hypothetical protein
VETKEYVIRTQANFAYTYGLGEVVAPGVALFRETETERFYDLTKDELNAKLRKLGKVVLR